MGRGGGAGKGGVGGEGSCGRPFLIVIASAKTLPPILPHLPSHYAPPAISIPFSRCTLIAALFLTLPPHSSSIQVYAYGITLWELFTGGNPFKGTPRALLGHLITKVWGGSVE